MQLRKLLLPGLLSVTLLSGCSLFSSEEDVLSLIHISEPTRLSLVSRMPSSA